MFLEILTIYKLANLDDGDTSYIVYTNSINAIGIPSIINLTIFSASWLCICNLDWTQNELKKKYASKFNFY